MDNEEIVGCSGSCGTCGGCGSSDEESLPILVLTDENGKEVTFEKLDVVVLEDGRSFLIVSELKEDYNEEVEVVILEIKEEDDVEVKDSTSSDSDNLVHSDPEKGAPRLDLRKIKVDDPDLEVS